MMLRNFGRKAGDKKAGHRTDNRSEGYAQHTCKHEDLPLEVVGVISSRESG
jgi:hypothetical protein